MPTQGKMQDNDDGALPRLHGHQPEVEADLAQGNKEVLSNGSETPSLSGGASRKPSLPATLSAKAMIAGFPPLPTLPAQITPRHMSDSEAILSLSPTSMNSSSNLR